MTAKQKQIKNPNTARSKVTKPVTSRVRRHAKKVLVPHKENQFRPHLIRAHGLIAVLLVALMAQVAYGFATTGHLSVLGRVSNVQMTELLADTNKEREAHGLSDLTINEALNRAAALKAQNMLAEQYWAHVSPSGIEPWKWFGDAGYDYGYAGENLAKNYPTADATVQAWMNSDTHRANILKGEYVDVGFAVVQGELEGDDTTLVVALYGAPSSAIAGEATTQTSFAAPTAASDSQRPLTYFGSALEALSPVSVAILGLLGVVAIVGVLAHHYRKQLPKALQNSWRVHNGMYTFIGMIALGVLIIIATGGGQI